MTFQKLFMPACAAAAILLGSCTGADNPFEPNQNVVEVAITNSRFSPSDVTVSPGTTVRWRNNDALTGNDFHTVDHGTSTNPGILFNFTFTDQGDTGEHTFNSAGTFPYRCRHGETGRIVVQ